MTTQATADLELQYRAMREDVALVDPGRATLRVIGADAVDFLQGQVTNDIEALEPGTGCYALLLNPKGRILADMRVLMLTPEELLVDSRQHDTLRSTLSMYTIGRDARVSDAEMSVLSLVGPSAASALGLEPPEAEHAFVQGRLGELDVIAVRTDAGVDLLFASADAARSRRCSPRKPRSARSRRRRRSSASRAGGRVTEPT